MAERLSSAERIHRLLALLRHVAAHPDGVPIDELTERFALRRDHLLRELDMATMVGADSADFHEMPFEVYVDEGLVFCRLFGLDEPFRLTPQEALALIVSTAGTVRDEDPNGPLVRGLDKIAAVLGFEPDEIVGVDLTVAGGPTGQLAEEAIRSGHGLGFRYWAYATDDVSERDVDPWAVVSHDGAWYLIGHDHGRGEPRHFRIDRMSDARITDRPRRVDPPEDLDVTIRLDDLPTAVLDVAPSGRWALEMLTVHELEERDDGWLRVTVPVAGRRWLERVLLRLGSEARLVRLDPSLGDEDIVASAAARMLLRYGASAGDH